MNEFLQRAAKNAKQAEVFEVRSRRTPVRFEANELKQVQTKESFSTALRILKDGRVGFASASGAITPEALASMAEDTARFGPEANYTLPGAGPKIKVEIYDPAMEQVTLESMVDLGRGLIAKLRDHTPELYCEGAVTRSVSTLHLANTEGVDISYQRSVFSVSFEGVLAREGDLLFVGDDASSCKPFTDVSNLVRTMTGQLQQARVLARLESGRMPVIFSPRGVASSLMSPLAVAFNGKMVVDGASPLRDRKGEEVFSSIFSLHDDSTLPLRPGSSPCDDEGLSSRRTPLVEDGVVKNFLFDLNTAALAGVESTGSGRRTGGLPGPGLSSLVIAEGDSSLEQMLKGISSGLLVEVVMGAEQGNLLSGDFTGNVLLGYAISGGQLAGRVKDTVISGNAFQLLGQAAAASREAEWVGGILRSPYILCPEVSVAARMV
jgi:PmbA protein